MEEQVTDYERAKRTIRTKQAREAAVEFDMDEFDQDRFENSGRALGFGDFTQIGAKVLIGGGLGLLAGVAAIAVTASAAEVILAGAITKVAGVVGGATGLSLGIRKLTKKKRTGV
ncbi:MAG: hypothetical protein JRJ51_08255 [Deltaproteobacteria bacterium]|nr:hypothetical protein [Deltaproteobacteria bacterium]